MLSIEYYRKLKDIYHKQCTKAQFIYIYTHDSIGCACNERCVTHVMFKSRKNKYEDITDVPHDKLLLSRDQKLPKDVIVQVKFSPLTFTLFEA